MPYNIPHKGNLSHKDSEMNRNPVIIYLNMYVSKNMTQRPPEAERALGSIAKLEAEFILPQRAVNDFLPVPASGIAS